jgi:deoxyribonuclease V
MEYSMKGLHAWDLSPREAKDIQTSLRARLVLEWDAREVERVAGVDVHFKGDRAMAAIVVLTFPELTPCEGKLAQVPLTFPYIPGLLAFREGPAVIAAWERLETRPDLVMFDAQGIAHPRGIGLASHMGLWFDLPSIGVAKSRLYGHAISPGLKRGDCAGLHDAVHPEKVIGMVVRTRDGVKPLYISPGHRMDVQSAVDFVLKCCTGYRLPEPTRWAHRVASGGSLPPMIDSTDKTGEQLQLL